MSRPQYLVTLYRGNGRVVHRYQKTSKYAAKRCKLDLEERYDETHYVTIEEQTEGDEDGV